MKSATPFLTDQQLYYTFQKCGTVSIDSRKVTNGTMFFALKGPNFDGNEFAAKAIKKGATFAVIDNPKYQQDERFLLVEDTLATFQRLAKMHRQHSTATNWLAIVGSNGKTTTKELIHQVLKEKYRTYCTAGNLNNHIGVPLTILNIPTDTEIAIIEMGANHLGEHHFLCEIAQPDFGLITNCGKDHLEGYGSVEQVILSNTELYDYLRNRGGVTFVNVNDEILLNHSEGIDRHYYGSPDRTKAATLLASGTIKSYFPRVEIHLDGFHKQESESIQLNTQLYGSFQKTNVLAAVAIGRYFKVSDKAIKNAIATYQPRNNRSETMEWGSNTVFLDGYNANPSSVLAIVRDFQNHPVDNKILVLGDMYELGDYALAEHEKILQFIEDYPYQLVLLIGDYYAQCNHRSHFKYFKNSVQAKKWIKQQAFENCYFLAKASRGIQVETIFK